MFVANRDPVAPTETVHVTNNYSSRWDIENQYKSVCSVERKTAAHQKSDLRLHDVVWLMPN